MYTDIQYPTLYPGIFTRIYQHAGLVNDLAADTHQADPSASGMVGVGVVQV